jgi:hypothetical protein
MSDKRICKYCGMELSEDVPHGLRECHLHAVARIAELKGVIEILEDQQREVKNILIDKNLHIDSLYEEGYKLQQRIAELEEAQRWIPVSERLPELRVGRVDLVYTVYGEIHSAMYLGNGWTSLYRDFRSNEVTHWMPIPKLPEVQQ